MLGCGPKSDGCGCSETGNFPWSTAHYTSKDAKYSNGKGCSTAQVCNCTGKFYFQFSNKFSTWGFHHQALARTSNIYQAGMTIQCSCSIWGWMQRQWLRLLQILCQSISHVRVHSVVFIVRFWEPKIDLQPLYRVDWLDESHEGHSQHLIESVVTPAWFCTESSYSLERDCIRDESARR